MKIRSTVLSLTLPALLVLPVASCKEKITNNRCQCIDNNGATVLDTVYYMESDEAYQICEGKEGTQNIWKCECTEY